ncbi:MFS transporter [Suttonella ornithocola]|uniref:Lysophospholipid transporter lplT n=1 Tax=Suttonella ornithocola TaxID=279832 RepID=A0A380MQ16_9GAMM|nr:MFS transporter [Suttonella ornithocola]SUO94156.1 Lysophospholipid transporter lplT [Suttonella ornithocola]
MFFFSQRFFPFFITQFFGAFNDNLFKNAMLIFFSLTFTSQTLSLYTNLAMALFILPMFLFSAWSGLVADRLDKRRLILWLKGLELAIVIGGIAAFLTQSPSLMMLVLCLLGLQSAFFGPVKYGILPERLDNRELMLGNGYVEAGTFLAILAGTLLGADLVGRAYSENIGLWPFYLVMLSAAGIGAIAAWFIPKKGGEKATLPPFHPWQQTKSLLKYSYQRKNLFNAILAISWFWMIGAVLLTQIPQYSMEILGGTPQVTTYLLALFSVGIGLGSVSANALTKGNIDIGVSAFAAFLMLIFLVAITVLAAYQQPSVNPMGFIDFWHSSAFIPTTLAFLGMAFSGGWYVVPLYALLQAKSEEGHKSQIIAANNIINSFFMVLISLISILILSVLGLPMAVVFGLVAIVHLFIAIKLFHTAPYFILRLIAQTISHSGYRLRFEGMENIPAKGAALLICNHVSYMDALILIAAVRRPIRFIIYYKIFQVPFLNWLFRNAQTIPIAGRHEDISIFNRSFDLAAEMLEKGELVLIFPEGSLTKDGEVADFRRGVELILKRTPVPVIPMYLDGLWGSFYSHKSGMFKGLPKTFRPKVKLTIGAPLSSETPVNEMKKVLVELNNNNN